MQLQLPSSLPLADKPTFRCTMSLKSLAELSGMSCTPEYLGRGKGLVGTCLHSLNEDEASSNHPYHPATLSNPCQGQMCLDLTQYFPSPTKSQRRDQPLFLCSSGSAQPRYFSARFQRAEMHSPALGKGNPPLTCSIPPTTPLIIRPQLPQL